MPLPPARRPVRRRPDGPLSSAAVATDAALLELGARTRHIVIARTPHRPPPDGDRGSRARSGASSRPASDSSGLWSLTPSTSTNANEPVIAIALRFGSVLIATGTAAF